MLKIEIIAVGKDKDPWVTDGCAHFEKLLSRHARVSWRIIPTAGKSSLSPAQIKDAEAKQILAAIEKGFTIALADGGKAFDTHEFADALDKWLMHSQSTLRFVIGGPYGLDQKVLAKADLVVSLSPLTFSHQIVRLVLLEQLYRAFTIIRGGDYHK